MGTILSDDCKKKCQIFTPNIYVKKMLDWVGYKGNELYGKKVLEPSFGQGNILIEVVKRYINSTIDIYSIEDIKRGLESDIYGIEYDSKYYQICIDKLNAEVSKYGIFDVKWNFYCRDTLFLKFDLYFDYIIGNPPYISYRDLDLETREFVYNNFDTCKDGKFDYCYAFLEYSFKNLSSGGKLCFLIPASIFKNVFAKKIRNYLLDDLTDIYDFGTQKIFNEEADGTKRKILTSSAIIVLEKGSDKLSINYNRIDDSERKIRKKVNKNELNDQWIFFDSCVGNRRFGDYYKVAYCLATLCNEAFILSENEELYSKKSSLIRQAASPKGLQKNIKEKIIFPYYYRRGKIKRIEQEVFENKYKDISAYLLKYRDKLDQRDFDLNSSWFEYGRSQALADMNQEKLLVSTIITGKVYVHKLSKETIPYSGLYIIPISDMTLGFAKELLESENFFDYVKVVGIPASGNSIRISSKDISNYYFD